MSQRSSVSPPLPTAIFFSTLTPDAPEACANTKPLRECPSPAAPPVHRRVLRRIDGWLDIGGLYNGHFEGGDLEEGRNFAKSVLELLLSRFMSFGFGASTLTY